MKSKLLVLLLLITALFLLSACTENSVDLTGTWTGIGNHSSGLRATISGNEIIIKYQPTSSMSKVLWSGSYTPAKGNPPSFTSKNDYAYTQYLGTISNPELVFTYQDNKLTFSSKPMLGEEKTYTLIRK